MAEKSKRDKRVHNPKRFMFLLSLVLLLALGAREVLRGDTYPVEVGYRSEESGILYDYTPAGFEAALSSGRPTLLDFSTDWCPPCRVTAPILEELREEYKGRVNILTANADNERELVQRFGVEWYPTFIFFDSDGEEAMRIQGLIFEEDFRVAMEELLHGNARSPGITTISPGEVLRRMTQGEKLILLDVRTSEEYAAGHIPGAISLPLSRIQSGDVDMGFSSDDEIIVYCQGGIRSRTAARMLRLMGFKNVKDMGGILEWNMINGPIVY
jgi:rhodanese-related sulfurtransferase